VTLKVEEINELINKDINTAKKKLAFFVTADCHSETSAKEAEEKAVSIFEKKSFDQLDIIELTENKSLNILDIITNNNIVPSKSEGKRLILGGGIKLNDDPINDHNYTFTISDNEKTLRVGKKKIFKLKYA
jgi:tyrosyl-tRNA synthetase